MMEQEQGMKGFTELAVWSFLQPNSAARPNIRALEEAVKDLCRMTMQKTMGQRKGNKRDINAAENLERVKFTIIAEATLLVLSGKLEKLKEAEENESQRRSQEG